MDLERPKKRTKLFMDDEDDDSNPQDTQSFTVNEQYAKRFEHNKQREELRHLEDANVDVDEDSESSTESDEDDDNGSLASGELDEQVQATLEAIRRKDPRIYDKDHKFYTDIEESGISRSSAESKPKPMYLRDYHRKMLLEGKLESQNSQDHSFAPQTYDEEQRALKNAFIQEIHAAVQAPNSISEAGDVANHEGDDEFLVSKLPAPETAEPSTFLEPQSAAYNSELIKETNPDDFLDRFMSTKAWKLPPHSQIHPFESDDEEEESKAEAYEEAYNLRFEDPERSNEKLMTHARDSAARYSARKAGPSVRRRAKEAEKVKKETEKRQRAADTARLRQLKILEMERQLQKIKEAAGLRDEALDISKWATFLDEAWDNENWELEMTRKFDESYYADQDRVSTDGTPTVKKSGAKKPKWDDDIVINDLVPDFQEQHTTIEDLANEVNESDVSAIRKGLQGKDKERKGYEKEKERRRERRHIENLVNERLDKEEVLAGAAPKHHGTFRYRETSPVAYGMTPSDILMASDSQLNQFAGLKKLAAFRAPDQKSKDKRRLGKKGRLRQWRKEAFGNENGYDRNRHNDKNSDEAA